MPDWRPDGHGESLWVEGERVAYVQHDAGGAYGKTVDPGGAWGFARFEGPEALTTAKAWAEESVPRETVAEPKPKRKRST
jgi:hypothetical protein